MRATSAEMQFTIHSTKMVGVEAVGLTVARWNKDATATLVQSGQAWVENLPLDHKFLEGNGIVIIITKILACKSIRIITRTGCMCASCVFCPILDIITCGIGCVRSCTTRSHTDVAADKQDRALAWAVEYEVLKRPNTRTYFTQ